MEGGSVLSYTFGVDDSELFQGEVGHILLYFVDWLDLFPYCVVQVNETIEMPIIPFLDGFNADEGYSAFSLLD